MKTRLNLATHRFPRYRTLNLVMMCVLLAALGAGGWLLFDFRRNPPDVETLRRSHEEVRLEWEGLGQRIAEIEGRLQQPEANALLEELTFLSQIMARKEFSWTLVLREIERVIPRSVMLVGLIPEIGESGRVFLQMEARALSYDDISEFITNLETTDSFRDVKVASDSFEEVDGREEVRVVMGADYVAAAINEVTLPGD